tara:strand:+ start:2676 stop:3950 length:1275 start_codon:yes stop_codon:yes gene_type:complete
MIFKMGNKAPHIFFSSCAVFCLAFGFWASVSTLDIISTAQGEVVPSTRIKSIQHLEGGIIRRIAVNEGQRVQKNDVLVELDPTASTADLGELQVRLNSLKFEISRLTAELNDQKTPKINNNLQVNFPQLAMRSLEQFNTRMKAQKSRLQKQRHLIVQRASIINEIRSKIKSGQKLLKLKTEQINISDRLVKDDLSNRFTHLNLLISASEVEGRIVENKANLVTANAAWKEAQFELKLIENEFKEEVNKELEEANTNLDELNQRLNKFDDSLERTTLRSPVTGIIKTVYFSTAGGVIKPGETIIDIVPGQDSLVIEAKLPTQDIGYVQAGQEAFIQLASADAMKFDKLPGKVKHVSPDTIISNDGLPFYTVKIETKNDHFERASNKYYLYPGMQVTASIKIGDRTVMDYILDPLQAAMDEAMTER